MSIGYSDFYLFMMQKKKFLFYYYYYDDGDFETREEERSDRVNQFVPMMVVFEE